MRVTTINHEETKVGVRDPLPQNQDIISIKLTKSDIERLDEISPTQLKAWLVRTKKKFYSPF